MTSDSDGATERSAAAAGEARREAASVRAAAGSARAAARASAGRAGAPSGKGRPTPSRARRESHGNIAQRIVRFLREVVAELRKVIWPTKNEMTTYSVVVIIFLVVMIALTWGADLGFLKLVGLVFG